MWSKRDENLFALMRSINISTLLTEYETIKEKIIWTKLLVMMTERIGLCIKFILIYDSYIQTNYQYF